ncbi:hypothetical protein AV530_000639 [Patagioenas fasciata monilis]|uniref:Uncharacterized protein n=1 Tax=Patagioenas fasciata monilis TaxID=372326 RepID=A0A1V4IG16_PATFA|nr:hypothetical protein AV530_000639 [Patagioenas fasciata monilis]
MNVEQLPEETFTIVNRELHLNNNRLQVLPFELGKQFQLETWGSESCFYFFLGIDACLTISVLRCNGWKRLVRKIAFV